MNSLEPLLLLVLFKHWGLYPSPKSSDKSHPSSKTPNHSNPRPKLSIMPVGMVWQEKTLWFSSLLTNTDEQRNILLVSLSISCSLWQCCQSFFGLAVTKITKTQLSVELQDRVLLLLKSGMGRRCGDGGQHHSPGAGDSAQGTGKGSQLGQGHGVGSHPCLAGASSPCTSIFSSLGHLLTVSPFFPKCQHPQSLVLQGKLSLPSIFNLFLLLQPHQNFSSFSVLWVSFWRLYWH